MKRFILLVLIAMVVGATARLPAQDLGVENKDSTMVTVFLKHIQDNPVDSIQLRAMKQHFYEKIEASRARVVSWYVVMGIGQVLTLKFPARDLRTVNQIFEQGAWGAFRTEFYPTYDFAPIWPDNLKKEKQLAPGKNEKK